MNLGDMMKKLLIFDVDGTVLDTIETITFHINKAINEFGIESVDSSYTSSVLGYSSVFLMEKVLQYRNYEYDMDTFNEILDLYHKYYQGDVSYLTKPYEGIVEMLTYLRDKGYILTALSNKPDHTLSVLFDKIDFKKYFDFSIGQVDDIPKKPDPYMINYIVDKYSLKKEDICLIGDSEVDFKTAKNADIDFIAVTWGFRTKEQLESLNSKYIVDSVKELREVIEGEFI